MKRLTALFLLGLFLFNAWGYLLLFQYLIYRSDNFAKEQISKDLYNPADLVEIKIPVLLPNICNWEDYEQISGQVQLKGHCYNYVKLKITRDTMFLMCIPNYETTRLINANIICARQVSDTPLTKKNQAIFKLSFQVLKYHYEQDRFLFFNRLSVVKKANTPFAFSLSDPFITTPAQPPDALV